MWAPVYNILTQIMTHDRKSLNFFQIPNGSRKENRFWIEKSIIECSLSNIHFVFCFTSKNTYETWVLKKRIGTEKFFQLQKKLFELLGGGLL